MFTDMRLLVQSLIRITHELLSIPERVGLQSLLFTKKTIHKVQINEEVML